MVGEMVSGKTFGPQMSKVYRLNQASASSAADYLASLGAQIRKVVVTPSTNFEDGSSKDVSSIFEPCDLIEFSTNWNRLINFLFVFLRASSGSTFRWRPRFTIEKIKSPNSSLIRS